LFARGRFPRFLRSLSGNAKIQYRSRCELPRHVAKHALERNVEEGGEIEERLADCLDYLWITTGSPQIRSTPCERSRTPLNGCLELIPRAVTGREGRNRTGIAAMSGRQTDVERSSEPQRTALRRGAAFGNLRKRTTRPGGVGHEQAVKTAGKMCPTHSAGSGGNPGC